MRYFFRFIAPRRFNLLLICLASLLTCSAFASPAHAASQSKWKIVHSPKQGFLQGVAAFSSNDVWAVGNTGSKPLIEHWNGSSWSAIPSPNPGSDSALDSVAVVSANDVWAVGTNGTGTLTENWNGSSWTIVPSPSPDSGSALTSVAVASANDIWASGYSETGGSTGAKTLTEHWNGSSWKRVPSPSPKGGGTIGDALLSLTVGSTNNVWAVGYHGTGDAYTNTLIENWNGSKWRVVSSPSPGDDSYFQGAAAVPGTSNAWAVGFYGLYSSPFHTLTEYYG